MFYSNNQAFASSSIFSYDFNSDINGTTPKNWLTIKDQNYKLCDAPWLVDNGRLRINIIDDPSCMTNLVPDDSLWKNLGDNYIFEIDMTLQSGTDHNIAFRFNENNTLNDWYDLHFQSPGDFILERTNPGIYNVFEAGVYPHSKTYYVKVLVNKNNIKVYIDNKLVRDFTSTVDRFPHGRIALKASAGTDASSDTYFDNIRVTKIDNDLEVPLLKQIDPLWKDFEYDSASAWSPKHPTIGAWGCAMTSAAMVLRYYGYMMLPDRTSLDPGTLNDWLKKQKDGYVNGGLINWLAISRLSAAAAQINNISTFKGLEFRRLKNATNSDIASDINNGIPDILEEPGHFIVAKGINGNSFNINDPYYNRLTLEDGYNNTFLSAKNFRPTNSDFSYMMFVTNSKAKITVFDSSNNPVDTTSEQQIITNTEDPTQTNGKSLQIIYLTKPNSGSYKIKVENPNYGMYQFDSYFYDQYANAQVIEKQLSLNSKRPMEFVISYDKDDSNNTSLQKIVTYDITSSDLAVLRETEQIKNNKVGKQLADTLYQARRFLKIGWYGSLKNSLKKFEDILIKNNGIAMVQNAYDILFQDVKDLQNQAQQLRE